MFTSKPTAIHFVESINDHRKFQVVVDAIKSKNFPQNLTPQMIDFIFSGDYGENYWSALRKYYDELIGPTYAISGLVSALSGALINAYDNPERNLRYDLDSIDHFHIVIPESEIALKGMNYSPDEEGILFYCMGLSSLSNNPVFQAIDVLNPLCEFLNRFRETEFRGSKPKDSKKDLCNNFIAYIATEFGMPLKLFGIDSVVCSILDTVSCLYRFPADELRASAIAQKKEAEFTARWSDLEKYLLQLLQLCMTVLDDPAKSLLKTYLDAVRLMAALEKSFSTIAPENEQEKAFVAFEFKRKAEDLIDSYLMLLDSSQATDYQWYKDILNYDLTQDERVFGRTLRRGLFLNISGTKAEPLIRERVYALVKKYQGDNLWR
jgi:hypothetical protein